MRVDHLVWYSPNLAQGEAHFADRLDCRPAYGGVHPGEGTANCLVSLGPRTYIEILGQDPAQPESSLDPELRTLRGSGLYHWGLSGADLAELRAKAIAAGLDGSEVVAGGRKLPNGNSLSWKLFGIRNHGFRALVPFFIDWLDSEHPAETAPRCGSLIEVEVHSPAPEKLRNIYDVLGIDIPVGSGPASLMATVGSRSERHRLHMFDPVPRGFVI